MSAFKAKFDRATTDTDGNIIISFAVSRADSRPVRECIDGIKANMANGKDTLKVSADIWREKRSLDANAYAWVLIDKIAQSLSVDRVEVYRTAIKSIGGVSETVCVKEQAVERLRTAWAANGVGWQSETIPSKIDGCVNVVLYYGSSAYDTKQMSLLIDHLVQDCKNLGIETMTPEELKRLFESDRSRAV